MGYFFKIDLHGHTRESAKKALDTAMKGLPSDVHEVEIIHGYHQGTAIREMVRRYQHPKIERKILGMNQGTTIFLIKHS